jgi:hypothetical protein
MCLVFVHGTEVISSNVGNNEPVLSNVPEVRTPKIRRGESPKFSNTEIHSKCLMQNCECNDSGEISCR